jgi:hypothetical protein
MKIAVTVEFTHEVDGKRVSETIEALLPVGDRKAYTDEAFKTHVAERLEEELRVVQPEIVRYGHHGEPMIEL